SRGHFMLAIDPAAFGDAVVFRRSVSEYVREVKASRSASGAEPIRIPGERAFSERSRRLREGVPISERVLAATAMIAREAGVLIPDLTGTGPGDRAPVP